MRLTVNGESRTVAEPANVHDLLHGMAAARSGVAVAVNGDVVPRSAWQQRILRDGDAVEILTAVQGG